MTNITPETATPGRREEKDSDEIGKIFSLRREMIRARAA